MDSNRLRYSIGQLSRLTGLPVRTIRFYGDAGLVPESGRTPAGYRWYGLEAAERLGLVRSLRELGLGLPAIHRVLAHEVTIAQVAATHAEAIDVQIRTLRLRRALLTVIAERGVTPEEVELMHRLAQLSEAERRRMVEDFVDEVFAGVDANPDFVAQMRSALPDLPVDPSPDQVDAWIELGEMISDPDFRRRIRLMAESYAEDPSSGNRGDQQAASAAGLAFAGAAEEARARGLDPASPEAAAAVGPLLAEYAAGLGRRDGAEFREWFLGMVDTFVDRQAERYWQLLGIINGWPPIPSTVPAWEWAAETVRAHLS
ncbi:MAG TPA: MerR family transcriptional regulator [Acidimicrobiales bacterium]|nr:MerR family transcriptional regulator [Acidimicrobiales bacterium]HLI57910.1 MerR family transcriptional regulator [Actinomycetota bacterium]